MFPASLLLFIRLLSVPSHSNRPRRLAEPFLQVQRPQFRGRSCTRRAALPPAAAYPSAPRFAAAIGPPARLVRRRPATAAAAPASELGPDRRQRWWH